jgi:WSC domain-containing protein
MRLQTMAPTPFGLAMLALCAAASAESVLNKRDEEPALAVKPGTISTCNFWYDNGFGESCEVVRDWFFEISPEDFHRWNPSVSLDCQGWEDWYSYCVRIEDSSPSTTSSKPSTTTAATTTSTSAPPKPTVKT